MVAQVTGACEAGVAQRRAAEFEKAVACRDSSAGSTGAGNAGVGAPSRSRQSGRRGRTKISLRERRGASVRGRRPAEAVRPTAVQLATRLEAGAVVGDGIDEGLVFSSKGAKP